MTAGQRQDKASELITRIVGDLYQVETIYRQSDRIILSLIRPDRNEKALILLRRRLRLYGYDFSDERIGNRVVLTINPKRSLKIPPLNILLFILTLLSVYLVPVYYQTRESFIDALAGGAGLMFTAALMSILFVHEMGHFIASRRRGIVTSLPYFIPAPNLIGTFGAVIKSKSPFWNRRDLIEVGAAGPIAGWLVALFWLAYGLSGSSTLLPDAEPTTVLFFSLDWESILMKILVPLLVPNSTEGSFYILNEAAFAGWVGLLITAMNLLPIGQFDGGHILYGALHKHQKLVGWAAMGALAVLGFQFKGWWLFAAFGLFFGVGHPPTLDDRIRPSRVSLGMAVISLIILILSFTPIPFG